MNDSQNLHYFKPGEFREWWGRMDPRLLVLLDTLRHRYSYPIAISPHPRAIGREDGGSSWHDYKTHGRVYAVDVLPADSQRRDRMQWLVEEAQRLGFTGIGVYPGWEPRPGLHVDTRTEREPGDPATWGYINGKAVALSDALAAIDD